MANSALTFPTTEAHDRFVIRAGLAIAFGLMLTLAVIPSPGQPAGAAGASCASVSNNRFNGWFGYAPGTGPTNWNESPIGAKARLELQRPEVCKSVFFPDNFSTKWVMIYDKNSNPLYKGQYVQAGYMRVPTQLPNGQPSTCVRHFAEYSSIPGAWKRQFSGGCVSPGGYYYYEVRFTGPTGPYPYPYPAHSSGNRFSMYVGSTHILTNDVDPWAGGWSFSPAYMGETIYAEDDVPGTSSNVSVLTNLQIQSVDTGNFRSTPCYLNARSDETRYHRGASSCTFAWIWTDPL